MSFEVKVTYLRNGETRKFKTDSTSFPSFAHLYNQLYNIFHLSHDFYLSKLLFSPNTSERGRILIGKDVRSSGEYDACVAPYLGQHFGNALLRITVSDDPPRNFSRLIQGRGSSATAVSRMNQRNHTIPSPYAVAAPYVPPVSFAHIPPPPVILPQMPLTHVPSVSSTSHEDRSSNLLPSSPVVQQQHAHTQCCDASQVKADVHALISSFKEDLNGVLVKAYGHSQLEGWTPNYQGAVIPPAVPAFSPAQTPKLEFRMNPSCITCLRQPTGLFLKCHVCSASKCSSCADLPEPLQCTGPFGHAWETTFTSEGSSDAAPNFDFVPSSTLLGPEDQSVLADWPISNFPAADSDAAPIGRPVAPVLPEPTSAPQAIPEPPVSMNHPTAPVHANVTCDMCDSVVVGTRHKCLDCPDYDLCQSCVDQGGAQRHQPFHEFIDIKEPGRVIVHTVFDSTSRRMPTRSPPQASEPVPAPAPATHRANCDLCESRIVGERYKCLSCPDFDTCQSCFAITKEQHPGHGFVKIKDPQDYIGRAIPKMRHNAICDSCNKIIYGVRYKCMHPDCPDYDLCDGCEAHPISQHNPKHPMLKMRSPSVVVPRLNSVLEASRSSQSTVVTVPVKDAAEVKEQAEPSASTADTKASDSTPVEQSTIPRTPSPKQEKVTTVVGPELDSPDMDTFSLLTRAPTLLSQMLQQERERLSHLIGLAERVTPESMGFFDVFAAADVPPVMKAGAAAVDVPVVKATSTAASDIPVMKDTAESNARAVVDVVAEFNEAAVPSGPGFSVIDQVPESSKEASVGNPESISQAGADIIEDNAQARVDTPEPIPQANTTTEMANVQVEALSSPPITFEEVLDAACVQDVTIKHGQMFPPGAEFVKVWKLRNSGSVPWPASTEIAFEGGEPLNQDGPAFVGTVPPGDSVDVWTGGLKAPDSAGRYVGYWRLRDGSSKVPFGDLVWVDVAVEEANNSEGDALSSSSIIVMPQSAGVGSRHWSMRSKDTEDGSDDGSLSLISVPSSSSSALSDFAEFTPTEGPGEAAARNAMDYVVLYDEISSNSGED